MSGQRLCLSGANFLLTDASPESVDALYLGESHTGVGGEGWEPDLCILLVQPTQ